VSGQPHSHALPAPGAVATACPWIGWELLAGVVNPVPRGRPPKLGGAPSGHGVDFAATGAESASDDEADAEAEAIEDGDAIGVAGQPLPPT
jgi:hypothetical protein